MIVNMTDKNQKKNGTGKMEDGFLPFDFFETEEPQGRKKKKTEKDTIPDLFGSLDLDKKEAGPANRKKQKTEADPEIEKESSAEDILEKAPDSDIIVGFSEENDGTAQDFKVREKIEKDEYFPEDDIKFEISYSETENINDKNTEDTMTDNEIRPAGEDIPGLENTEEAMAQSPVLPEETKLKEENIPGLENAEEAKAQETAPEEKIEEPKTLSAAPVKDKTPGTRVPVVQRPVVKEVFSVKNKNASPGEILQEGRVHSGLSINQVEQITKIRLSYLESIERDDFPKLPPVVYVIAYIKTLCSLYNISPEDTALVLSNLKKSGEKPVTEDILKHLESEKHVNIQEEVKSKRLIMKSFFIIALVIVWIGILGLIVYKSGFIKKFRSSGKTVAVKTEKSKASKPVISIKTVKEAEEKTRETTVAAAKEKTKNTAAPKNVTKEVKPKDNKEVPAVQFSSADLEKFVPPQNISLSELTLDSQKAKK